MTLKSYNSYYDEVIHHFFGQQKPKAKATVENKTGSRKFGVKFNKV